MSKITPLPRIDRDYQKNLKFPDINDFLKDTSYLEAASAIPDNQTYVVLQPKASNSTTPVIMPNFIVNGVHRSFYMTPIEFYGFNPDLEAVERAVINVDFLGVTSSKTITLTRGDGDDRLITLPGQQIIGSDINLYNYKFRLSVLTVGSILTWIFDTNKEKAREYFAGDYTTLQEFISNYFYTMTIPISISLYYFNSADPAVIYSTSLSFASLTTVLRSSLVATSASAYTTFDYLGVKASFAAPITSNSLWLTATISGTSVNATEPVLVQDGAFSVNTSLLKDQVVKYAHQNYSVSYPTISFTYSANSEVFTGNAAISGAHLASFTPSIFLPIVQPLKIVDYFIGHQFDSDNFFLKITITLPQNVLSLDQAKTFLLEFMQPDNSKTEKYDPTGQVSSTVQKNKLVIRGSLTSTEIFTSAPATYSNSYAPASGIGFLNRSAYFSSDTRVRNSVVQKIFTDVNLSEYYSSDLSAFSTSFTAVQSSVAKEDKYVLSVKWNNPAVIKGLYLTAELPIIRLSIGDLMYQIYAQGTITKYSSDNYTRAENPFFNYGSNLKWYPRISTLLANNAPLTGSVKGGVTALDATTVAIPTTAEFYKLPVLNAAVKLTYTMRLYCRGYGAHPRIILNTAPVINRDALGFKIPYIKLANNSTSVSATDAAAVSDFAISIAKTALDNLNDTRNKAPRSYFLTNLKLITLTDKSTYYTYSNTGPVNYTAKCEIGFYYDKV